MKLHVDHDVRPDHVQALLGRLSPFVAESRERLLADLNQSGHRINPHYLLWNLKTMRALGLAESSQGLEGWRLSSRGVYLRALMEYNVHAFFDLMHYLYYVSWNLGNQDDVPFSWTYQTVCNLIFDHRPTIIDGKSLAAEVRRIAQRRFGREDVSITDYAIDGVYNWLRVLTPSFTWTDQRTRRRVTNSGRSGCSSELFLMGVDYLYRTFARPYRDPITLDDEKILRLCRLCLLDPQQVKPMAVRTAGRFAILKLSEGQTGITIVLERRPRLISWPNDSEDAVPRVRSVATVDFRDQVLKNAAM